MLTRRPGKAADQLDKILALIVLFVSAAMTICLAAVVKQPLFALGSFLVFIVCTTYLLLRKRLPIPESASLPQKKLSSKFSLLLNTIFFALLIYSIISLHLRPEIYVRPLGYFISTALMATVVGIEIILLRHTKSRTYFALFKIILIGLSLRCAQVLIYPDMVGVDPWSHRWFTTEMLNTGHIPGDFLYSELPLMHLFVGSISMITGAAYKLAAMLSITSMQIICDALFAFLLARAIFADKPGWGNRVGLLAALLIAVSNHHIYMGYLGIPNTMGATLILPIIYLLLVRRRSPLINTSLALLLIATLILTHTVAAMCLIILLFALWLASYIHQKIRHEGTPSRAILIISVSLAAAALGWWTYSGHIITLVQVIKRIFLAPVGVEVARLAYAPFSEQLFAYLGILLFFALCFMGLFYMVSKFEKEHSFAMAIGSMVIFGITAFAMFGGLADVLIGHRWMYFSQIMLAVPVGTTLLLFHETMNRGLAKILVLTALLLVLPLFMVISPQANMDNPTFTPTSLVRNALTESELQSLEFPFDHYDGTIASDYYCRRPVLYSLSEHQSEFVSINRQLGRGEFSDCRDRLILIRDEITQHSFPDYRDISEKLDYDPYFALSEQGFSRIYNCGSVSAFVW